MNESDSQTAYGVFKPVGHVLASFPTERDARSAVDALNEAGFPEVAYYPADEVLERAERDIERAGVLATIGQELNLVKQQRDLAREGHPFVSVLAPADDEARRVADIVARFHADRAQKYGRLIIEELIEPGSGQRQAKESPDTGLDPQTHSGVEAGADPTRH
ncbi:MAG TPA: hypothetical protein VIP05_12490 [Burkholderiaceae bacterium]